MIHGFYCFRRPFERNLESEISRFGFLLPSFRRRISNSDRQQNCRRVLTIQCSIRQQQASPPTNLQLHTIMKIEALPKLISRVVQVISLLTIVSEPSNGFSVASVSGSTRMPTTTVARPSEPKQMPAEHMNAIVRMRNADRKLLKKVRFAVDCLCFGRLSDVC